MNSTLSSVNREIRAEFHKPTKINFQRNHNNKIFQADLVEMITYSKENKKQTITGIFYKNILVIIN